MMLRLFLRKISSKKVNKLYRLYLRRLSEEVRLVERERDRYKELYYSLISIKDNKIQLDLKGDEEKLYNYIKENNFKTKTQAQEDLGLSYYMLNQLMEILEEKNLIKIRGNKVICM